FAGNGGERATASVDGEPFELARTGEGKIGIAGAVEQIWDLVVQPLELVDRLAEQLGEQLGMDRAHRDAAEQLDAAGLRLDLAGVDQELEGIVTDLEIIGVAGERWPFAESGSVGGLVGL